LLACHQIKVTVAFVALWFSSKNCKTTSTTTLTDIRRLSALLNLYWLRDNLILPASVEKQRRRLQIWIGQRWNSQVQMLALDNLANHGHISFGEVSDVCCVVVVVVFMLK